MYSPENSLLVALEQHRDRLRAAEQAYLLQGAHINTGNSTPRLLIAWLGRQLKALGTKLEQFGETAPTQHVLEM